MHKRFRVNLLAAGNSGTEHGIECKVFRFGLRVGNALMAMKMKPTILTEFIYGLLRGSRPLFPAKEPASLTSEQVCHCKPVHLRHYDFGP